MLASIKSAKHSIDQSFRGSRSTAIDLAFFLLSCIAPPTYYFYLLYCLTTIASSIERRLKNLFLLFLRGVLSLGVSCSTDGSNSIRLVIILAMSISIIYECLNNWKISNQNPLVIKQFLSFSFALTAYMLLESLFLSVYPLVSAMKWIMYMVPFSACVLGCYQVRHSFDLIGFMTQIMVACLVIGLVLIPSPLGYLRNGHAFQGVFNHPNIYGVLIVAFVALVLTRNLLGQANGFELLLVPAAIWLETLSESRTGMIGILGCLLLYVLCLRKISKPVIVIICIAAVLLLLSLINAIDDGGISELSKFWLNFFSKGRSGINVDSRASQILGSVSSFKARPMFGTGFMVPFNGSLRQNMMFSMDLVVEPGNIFLSILGYMGIFGSALMLLYYGWIVLSCRREYLCLVAAPFFISLGEMTFFSTNNCGLFCYFMIGIALVNSCYDSSSELSSYDASTKNLSYALSVRSINRH